MPKMRDKNICKRRTAAAVAILQELYEDQSVDYVENDTAA